MNAAVNSLYAEYLDHTGGDKAAAASLTLAAVMAERPPAVSRYAQSTAPDRAGSRQVAAGQPGQGAVVDTLWPAARLQHRRAGKRAAKVSSQPGRLGRLYEPARCYSASSNGSAGWLVAGGLLTCR